MKLLRGCAFAVALTLQEVAYGSVITVEFDVTITSKKVVGRADEPIVPMEHLFASMTFDNRLTLVDRLWAPTNPIMSHVVSTFGSADQTAIVSPIEKLTATNLIPNAPVVTSSGMRSILWYQLVPPTYTTVSFGHQIYAYSTMRSETHRNKPYSYEGESWERSVGIGSPVEYVGPMDAASIAAYDFASDDLMAYLTRMKDSEAKFSFSDQFSYQNRPTLLASGTTWSGTAVITRIIDNESVEVPEPSSLALIGLALTGLSFTHRRKA